MLKRNCTFANKKAMKKYINSLEESKEYFTFSFLSESFALLYRGVDKTYNGDYCDNLFNRFSHFVQSSFCPSYIDFVCIKSID